MQSSLSHIQDPSKARAYFENKVAFSTGPVELDHMIKSGENLVVVDVRAAEDYAKGHIPGAINLPQGTWENPQGLEKGKTNIVYCYAMVCHLAAKACVTFAGKGYPVMELDGGFDGWQEHELEIERESFNRVKGQGETAAAGRKVRM